MPRPGDKQNKEEDEQGGTFSHLLFHPETSRLVPSRAGPGPGEASATLVRLSPTMCNPTLGGLGRDRPRHPAGWVDVSGPHAWAITSIWLRQRAAAQQE